LLGPGGACRRLPVYHGFLARELRYGQPFERFLAGVPEVATGRLESRHASTTYDAPPAPRVASTSSS
jgi:hypothetical protein